jgi:signal transduction histidine kinase
MSLRAKLIALFGAFAIVPLLALSVFDYVQSARAIRRLLEAQTTAVAQRVARQATGRLELIQGDLALLAQNAEIQRFLGDGQKRDSAAQFVRTALAVMRPSIAGVSFRDREGREVLRTGSDSLDPVAGIVPTATWPVVVTISRDDGTAIGSMTARLPVEAVVTPSSLNDRVGTGGYTLVTDRGSGRVLLDPDSRERADSGYVTTTANVGEDGLAIVAAAAIGEFSGPLDRLRATSLFLGLVVTGGLALAFPLVAGFVTRSLETLTQAADQVGRGNFDPALPPPGEDEVGRLSASFRRMSEQVRDMMRQLEQSRQMAAIGAFSAQIAHEIRNPLTAIKLNLQSIERDVRDGRVDEASLGRPLEICMEEVQRLDRVVRGVLRLGRSERPAPGRVSVHETLDAAIDLTRKQLRSQNVSLETDFAAQRDEIAGEAGDLRGVLLNLLLNASEALPQGGRIRVSTAVTETPTGRAIEVRVADDGPGVPAAARESVFEPFYSTKRQGSGLGLAIAARDVESHQGRLSLAEHPGELGGATFVVQLPLAEGQS